MQRYRVKRGDANLIYPMNDRQANGESVESGT